VACPGHHERARGVLGALQAVAATAVECEPTRKFGVAWIPRAHGHGNEIRGVTPAQMDAYSTRTVQAHEKERELARAWEHKHGPAPTSRELLYLANDATLQSRKARTRARSTGTYRPPDEKPHSAASWPASRRRCRTRMAPAHKEKSITAAAHWPDHPRARPRSGPWLKPWS
jgi:TrwC relaxase